MWMTPLGSVLDGGNGIKDDDLMKKDSLRQME
jgi:hypothetical protein